MTGRLEQTCRTCGRWEAAGPYCSWCGRLTGPQDWYRNADLAERHERMPEIAPVDPPTEYRSLRDWPVKWGPSPYARKAPRMSETPLNSPATPDSRASALEAALTLGWGESA